MTTALSFKLDLHKPVNQGLGFDVRYPLIIDRFFNNNIEFLITRTRANHRYMLLVGTYYIITKMSGLMAKKQLKFLQSDVVLYVNERWCARDHSCWMHLPRTIRPTIPLALVQIFAYNAPR